MKINNHNLVVSIPLLFVLLLLISTSLLHADETRIPIGACCYTGEYLGCDVGPEDHCNLVGGVWLGENTECADCFNGPGACCLGWGIPHSCMYMNWDDCVMYEGYWKGEFADCDDCSTLGYDYGVCCSSTDPLGCYMTAEESCVGEFGWNIFLGPDTDCRLDSCNPECGDVDFSWSINILDVVHLINYKYKDGLAPFRIVSAEINGIEGIDVLDIVYLINFIYKDGPDPVCPGL